MLRRILRVMTVAALMVAMVVATAMPAAADRYGVGGAGPGPGVTGIGQGLASTPSGEHGGFEGQGGGAFVVHCQYFGLGGGAAVFTPEGPQQGTQCKAFR